MDLLRVTSVTTQKGIRWMRLSHARAAISVRFDDPNLVSCAGLVPVMALAERCGLAALLADAADAGREGHGERRREGHSRWSRGWSPARTRSTTWTCCATAGWAGCSTGVRAPSTLGTFLRAFTFGHVRQLDAVAARLLARLAAATPLLPGADQLVFVDIDDTVRQTYGYAKQGAGCGYTGVKGLERAARGRVDPDVGAGDRRDPAAEGIDELRPRRGEAAGRRAGHRRARAGAAGLVLVRADSAYYGHDVIAAARRAGARFSVTARLTPP